MIGRLGALALIACATVAGAAGCGGAGDDGPKTVTVRITDEGYEPAHLRIAVGDRVTFVNRSKLPQSAKDESGGEIDASPGTEPTKHDGTDVNHATKRGFSTHSLFRGERQTVVFRVPRLYKYHSSYGPTHTGTIEVAESLSDPERSSTSLRITRDFGRRLLASDDAIPLTGNDTLLRQLRNDHDVAAVAEGQFVEGIDGLMQRPDSPDGESLWVTNVNGVETDVFPVDYELYAGDVVQWDLRDWYVTLDVRATVGAFPETFTRGVFGGLFPVSVECEQRTAPACRRVKRTLREAGVRIDGDPPQGSQLPPPGNPQRARILVGKWRHWADGEPTRWVDAGPRRSGVFARFSPDARSMRLLDWNAHRVRSEGPGTGLVAAMRPTEEDLMWLVTGVDDKGVERAAAALDSDDLRDAYAVAVTGDGIEKLPLPPPADER